MLFRSVFEPIPSLKFFENFRTQHFAALGAYISAYIKVLVPGVTYLIWDVVPESRYQSVFELLEGVFAINLISPMSMCPFLISKGIDR